MQKRVRNAIVAITVSAVLAISFYALYDYTYNVAWQKGFNGGFSDGESWTMQQMGSTSIIFPGHNLSYPIFSQYSLLPLNTSQGYYRGSVLYGFQIGEVNKTTGIVNWTNLSEVAIEVVFQCGPYVASTGWIKASNSSIGGALSFNLSWIEVVHYAAYLFISASSPNGTPVELFFSQPLTIWPDYDPFQ